MRTIVNKRHTLSVARQLVTYARFFYWQHRQLIAKSEFDLECRVQNFQRVRMRVIESKKFAREQIVRFKYLIQLSRICKLQVTKLPVSALFLS